MALQIRGSFTTLTSHAQGLGIFDAVNKHEPKNAPSSGVACNVTLFRIDPAIRMSGLKNTAARTLFAVNIMQNFLDEPQDDIDILIGDAMDTLMEAYVANFAMGGTDKLIDVQGMHGEQLRGEFGYLDQDKVIFRVGTIYVPVIVKRAWAQGV